MLCLDQGFGKGKWNGIWKSRWSQMVGSSYFSIFIALTKYGIQNSPVWREEKKRNICVFLPFLNGWVGEKRKAKIEISFVFWLISLQEKRTGCYLEITLYVAYLFSFRLHLDGRLRYCKMFGFFSLHMFSSFGEI